MLRTLRLAFMNNESVKLTFLEQLKADMYDSDHVPYQLAFHCGQQHDGLVVGPADSYWFFLCRISMIGMFVSL